MENANDSYQTVLSRAVHPAKYTNGEAAAYIQKILCVKLLFTASNGMVTDMYSKWKFVLLLFR